ncbi:MAG TPA: DUF4336 domain-containing protein [Abditibacteriaceae bacterium]|jgi:hypothetical protein
MNLKPLAENIWVYEQPHHLAGVNIGARMTIVRTGDQLWLHSPIDAGMLHDEIAALGKVCAVVAPNVGHYMGLQEAAEIFPDAEAFAVPDIAKKFELDARLPEFSANEELHARRIRGSRIFDETVFLHAPSKTLVLTDLCMNLRRLSRRERVLARLFGIPPRFGVSRLERFLMRDRAVIHCAAQDILAWDFDRVIVSHGDIIERDGKAILRQALRRL